MKSKPPFFFAGEIIHSCEVMLGFHGGGGENDVHGAMPPRGMCVWGGEGGDALPGNFLKFMCSEVASGGF